MKKILLSILAIALTVGTVSASAYALFSTTVKVDGISITSGNAALGIYDKTGNQYTSATSWTVRSMLINKLSNFYPGKLDYTELWFRNESNSDIPLTLSAKLDSGTWNDDLGSKIEIAFSETGTSSNPPTTGWVSLNWLKSNNYNFGSLLKKSDTSEEYKQYKMFIRMANSSEAVDNALAGKALSGDIVFKATQI